MRFDALDAVFIAGGMGLLAVGLSVLQGAFGVALPNGAFQLVALLAVFGLVWLRRLKFGPPRDLELRRGPLWSLLSMAGLLTVFFAVGAFVMLAARLTTPRPPRPDFLAEAQAAGSNSAVLDELAVLGDPDAPAERERLARAREEAIEAAARERATAWDEAARERRATDWKIGAAGVGLLLLGAGAIELRRKRPTQVPALR